MIILKDQIKEMAGVDLGSRTIDLDQIRQEKEHKESLKRQMELLTPRNRREKRALNKMIKRYIKKRG